MDPARPSRWEQFDPEHPDPDSGSQSSSDHASATASFRDAMRQLAQLRAFAAHYAAARSDRLMASVRRAALWAAVGVIGVFLLAGVVVTAGVMLVTGLADALSRLLGTGPWAGELLAGVIVLVFLGGGAGIGIGIMRRKWRQQTERKYEQRQLQQRIDHGQDVRQCAAASDQSNGHS